MAALCGGEAGVGAATFGTLGAAASGTVQPLKTKGGLSMVMAHNRSDAYLRVRPPLP